jgi:hypothetical protein
LALALLSIIGKGAKMKLFFSIILYSILFNTYSFEVDMKTNDYTSHLSSSLTSIHTSYHTAHDDKKLHILAGTLISGTTTTITKQYLKDDKNADIKSMLAGTSTALFAGIAKELIDSKTSGTVDKYDAIYTVVPAALISLRFSYSF